MMIMERNPMMRVVKNIQIIKAMENQKRKKRVI
jgi:hypothetical protein